MATITESREEPAVSAEELTLSDLERMFGPMSIRRIRQQPAPGTATEADVLAIHRREKRLCELVDGVLVEKTVGAEESYLAGWLITLLNVFIRPRRLGIALGADGMYRLDPGLIRVPDVSFIAVDRLPGRKYPREPVCSIVPDLAIEVLSRGNTRQEMDRKLAEYFASGVRLVWYIDPKTETARVFTAVDQSRDVPKGGTLDGGAVLPGFELSLQELFAEPLTEPPQSQ